MPEPEIVLLLSSYQRPRHLHWALESIALQEGAAGRFEVVVTDDGSTDETPQVVADFARRVDFPVRFTTHPHQAFQLSRCRNEGVAASRAPYLLFLDGDCVLPRDHVRIHLERRKPGVVMAGDCCRFDEETSRGMSMDALRSGEYCQWISPGERRRLAKRDRHSRLDRLIRHPTKPRLVGNNIGIWRSDYERVNGFDENFQGWGGEDDDIRLRLRRAGVWIESILRWTNTYHLWHPSDPSMPAALQNGPNFRYLSRKSRLTCCRNGLVKRGVEDLNVHYRAPLPRSMKYLSQAVALARRILRLPVVLPEIEANVLRIDAAGRKTHGERPEVEILFVPGRGRFSGRAECNILVALEPTPDLPRVARRAHMILAQEYHAVEEGQLAFRLDQLQDALEAVA